MFISYVQLLELRCELTICKISCQMEVCKRKKWKKLILGLTLQYLVETC
jgi:hypothetical protein